MNSGGYISIYVCKSNKEKEIMNLRGKRGTLGAGEGKGRKMMRLYFNLKNQIKILKGDYTFISAGKKI